MPDTVEVGPIDEEAWSSTPGDPLLSVDGVSIDAVRRDGAIRLVQDISFDVGPGETVGLLGESGSGKTVSAMSIVGLLPPGLRVSQGRIHFAGRQMTGLGQGELRRVRGRDIGVVFQDPQNSLNPAFTVGNQLVEAIRAHTDVSAKEAFERGVELLDRVGISRPRQRACEYPHQLSGGMAQRAMIAIAICCRPKLLIADEPTTALDVTVQAHILALLRSLQKEFEMSLLLISHDLSVIAEMADRVAVLYAGQVVEKGETSRTFIDPSHPYTSALLGAHPGTSRKGARLVTIPGAVPSAGSFPTGCRFHPRCAFAVDACRRTEPAFVALDPAMAGVRCIRHTELQLPGVRQSGPPDAVLRATSPVATKGSAALLDVSRLHKEYAIRRGVLGRTTGSFAAVADVSLAIAPGETLGLVGESGAGKSTVGRLVLGLVAPTSGAIRFDGRQVASTRPRLRLRRNRRNDVQVIFQNPFASLDPTMTVAQIVAEPLHVQGALDRRQRQAKTEKLLEQVGLNRSYLHRSPQELSGGQRQRVAIARALALGPRMIVCDEPVSSLDASTQAQMINLLKDLQTELGISYLFIGHDLSVVHRISDRIAVMYRGSVMEVGPSDAIYRDPRHPYTRALLDAVLSVDPRDRRLPGVAADEPADTDGEAVGCPFASRCPNVMEQCRTTKPPAVDAGDGVVVSCHLYSNDRAAVSHELPG